MALVTATVCPCPPLLVPELASGAAPELEPLRTACRTAVGTLAAAHADVTYVVGADLPPRAVSFAPWGRDVGVAVPEPLALPLLVGGWLLAGRAASFVAVEPDLPAADCADLGVELADSADRVALLVMGDGSACRGERAPGYVHPAAEEFDAAVTRALGAADADALLAIDATLAAELLVSGRAPWQVLAGAAKAAGPLAGRVHHADAPYGVGYLVATWVAA